MDQAFIAQVRIAWSVPHMKLSTTEVLSQLGHKQGE